MGTRIASIVAGAVVMAVVAAPAAAQEPAAGCGAGFELRTIQQILPIAAPGFTEEVFRSYDKNNDNRLCVKVIPNEGGPPQFDPAFVFFDNKARGR